MMQYNRVTLGKQAKELGFVRDTFEKVCRLDKILQFLSSDPYISGKVVLKGGTAINLTMMDLPRLSVDIDLDYIGSNDRGQMLAEKEEIRNLINRHMKANGYQLSLKSKSYHALDSLVYDYLNSGGAKDNLKIEINYMLRCHILEVQQREIRLPWQEEKNSVLCVNPVEIFGTKIVALLTRAAARDLYDVHNMIRFNLFDKGEIELLKQCVAFYSAVGAERAPAGYSFQNVGNITQQKIKTDLYPVMRLGDRFSLEEVQKEIIDTLSVMLMTTDAEKNFWAQFNEGTYKPELILAGEMLDRVREHPMALWKCSPKDMAKPQSPRNSVDSSLLIM